MSFLKRWGKKRNEEGSSTANKTITKVDISAISNPSTLQDGSGQVTTTLSPVEESVQTSGSAWPLQEKEVSPGTKYWDEQRPLTMIPESPELKGSPRIQISSTDHAHLGFASDNRNPRNAPSGPRASPYPKKQARAPQPLQQTQQSRSGQPAPRVRLPKIPPPDSENWNPLAGHIAAQYTRPSHYQNHPGLPQLNTGLPSPPPTASTVGTHQSGSPMYSTLDPGSSPNWISFSYPSKHQQPQSYPRPKDMSVSNLSSSRTLLASPEITPGPTPAPRMTQGQARKYPRTPDANKTFARVQGMEDPFRPAGHSKGPSTPPRRPSTPTRQPHGLSRKPSNNKHNKPPSPLRYPSRHTRNVSNGSRQKPSVKRLSTHVEKSSVKTMPQRQPGSSNGKLLISPVRTASSPLRPPSPRRYVQESPRGRARHSRQGSSLSRTSRPRSRSSMISTRSRVMERNVRRTKGVERKQKKMTQLDEQINLIASRLQKLEALSEQLRTLPAVPEIEVEDSCSDRNDSVVDSEVDAKTVISEDDSDWETLEEEVSECTASSRQGQKSRFKMHTPRGSMSKSLGQSSAGHTYYTSALESIDSAPTEMVSRGSPTKQRGSVLETGLATRVACTRQAPAMVQLRNSNNSNTSPRKTPRSHRISRLGHRPQPSTYSFITFKSFGGSTANLHAPTTSDHDWFDHSRFDDEDLDADNDEFEDVLDEIDEASGQEEQSDHYIGHYRPGTSGTQGAASSASNLSLFPYQQKFRGLGSSTVSLRSGASSSSRGGAGPTYPYWSPEDLDTITRTTTPGSSVRRGPPSQDMLRSPIRRPSQRQNQQQHLRNASRTLLVDGNGKVTAAAVENSGTGNGRFAVADVKRWMQRVPRKVVHVRAPSRGEKPGSGCMFTGGRC